MEIRTHTEDKTRALTVGGMSELGLLAGPDEFPLLASSQACNFVGGISISNLGSRLRPRRLLYVENFHDNHVACRLVEDLERDVVAACALREQGRMMTATDIPCSVMSIARLVIAFLTPYQAPRMVGGGLICGPCKFSCWLKADIWKWRMTNLTRYSVQRCRFTGIRRTNLVCPRPAWRRACEPCPECL